MNFAHIQGDIRRREDLRQPLRFLAYDDIDIVAQQTQSVDGDLSGGEAIWEFILTAPDRLVLSEVALRVFSPYLDILAEVAEDPQVVRVEIESLRGVLYGLQRPSV